MNRRKSAFFDNSAGYYMLIPASIVFCVINLIPFLYGLALSFTDTNFFKPGKTGSFVGISNYIEILKSPEFAQVFSFTLLYTTLSVALSYTVGMILALLLNQDIKGRNIFRGIALIPWVMAPAAATIVWRWMLNDQLGFINVFLQSSGIIQTPIRFLSDKALARFSVIIFAVWKSYPFMMVVLLGGLQSIDQSLYEPARMDGANSFQCFRHITLPLLKPVSTVALSLMFIWTFNTNSFDNIYLLTKGGPVNATYVLSIESYHAAFYRGKMGYASATSLIMTLMISCAVIVYAVCKKRADIKTAPGGTLI